MAKTTKEGGLEAVSKALSVRIAELRTAKGLTQLQLAESARLEVQYVRKLEQADRAPSLKTLVALACGLRVPLVELFNFDGREITSPRTEGQLLRLRELMADAPEDDVKLLNRVAERLVAGPVPKGKARRR